jgi:tetratricopeptide (TPR) repeat protein
MANRAVRNQRVKRSRPAWETQPRKVPFRLAVLLALCGAVAAAAGYWHLATRPSLLPNASIRARPTLPFAAVSPTEVLGVSEQLPQSPEELKREAIQACDRLISDLPNSPEAVAAKALTFLRLGQTSVSAACWENALQHDAHFSPAHLGLGTIAFQRGDHAAGITHLRQALETNPRLPAAYSQLVQALLDKGEVQEAQAVAQQFVRQFPDSAESHYWLGQVYLQSEDFENARRSHKRASELAPDLARAYYSLAIAFARLGQMQPASEYRKKFAELSQRDLDKDRQQVRHHDDLAYVQEVAANVYRSVGEVYSNAGDIHKAEASWLRGAAIAPQELNCREALFTLYMFSYRHAEACQVAEKLTSLQPERADYYAQAAMAHAKLQNWEAARRAFRQTLERDPHSSEARLGLVAIHLESGQHITDVVRLAEEAAALAPSTRAYLMLSAIYQERLDSPGAIRAMQKALQLEPTNHELQDAYDRLVESSR